MTLRRIVMFNQVSADGFFADATGGLDWVVSDPEIHRRAVASMPATDLMLFGRHTYERFASFWPGALKDSRAAGPHGENKADPAFAAMARWLNDTPKIVYSRTLRSAGWDGTQLVPELRPKDVAKLKQGSGKSILIFGSGSLVAQLSEHGLIDEYRFVVCPVLLGSGRNLLHDMPRHVGLELLDAQSFETGNVLLTYAPKSKR